MVQMESTLRCMERIYSKHAAGDHSTALRSMVLLPALALCLQDLWQLPQHFEMLASPSRPLISIVCQPGQQKGTYCLGCVQASLCNVLVDQVLGDGGHNVVQRQQPAGHGLPPTINDQAAQASWLDPPLQLRPLGP